MLDAAIVRRDHAHARIVGIDTSAADTRTVAAARKLVPTANRRIILEVDSGIVGNPHSGENDHFINMRSPITTNANGDVSFDYWTWGQAVKTATMSTANFGRDYFGQSSPSSEVVRWRGRVDATPCRSATWRAPQGGHVHPRGMTTRTGLAFRVGRWTWCAL